MWKISSRLHARLFSASSARSRAYNVASRRLMVASGLTGSVLLGAASLSFAFSDASSSVAWASTSATAAQDDNVTVAASPPISSSVASQDDAFEAEGLAHAFSASSEHVSTASVELPEAESLPSSAALDVSESSVSSVPLKPGETGVYASEVYSYVIVGAGAAGFHALQAIRERDPDARVLVVSEESTPPYMRPPLSKELWRRDAADDREDIGAFTNWEGEKMSIWLPHDADSVPMDTNTRWALGRRATDLDADVRAIMLDDGTIVYFDKLLVATGGKPQLIPGVSELARQSDRVSTFRTIEDFEKLRTLVATPKESQERLTVAVVGGSFLGSELAAALAPSAQVVQIFPESLAMSLHLPSYLSQKVNDELSSMGVEIRSSTLVQSIDVGGDKENQVQLQLLNAADATSASATSTTLSADHVIVCAGALPAVDFARDADLEMDKKLGGLLVNSEYQTSRSHIFAAGDVASFYCPVLGRRRVEHFDHAVASGRQAGLNMTGERGTCTHIPMFWGDIGRLGFEALGRVDASLPTVGVFDKSLEAVERGPNAPPADAPAKYDRGLVYYLDGDQPVGVLAWNLFGKMDQARALLKRRKLYYDKQLLSCLIAFDDKEEGQ